MPEIIDGKNVWDFYDKDIIERLKKLEEEEQILLLGKNEMDEEDVVLDKDLFKAYEEVKSKRALLKLEHKQKRKNRVNKKNFELKDVEQDFEKKGKRIEELHERFKGRRKGRSLEDLYKDTHDAMDIEGQDDASKLERKLVKKNRDMSRSRSKGSKIELTDNDKVI